MKNKTTRRRFLKTIGAAASVAILGPSLFEGDTALAASFVRRDVGGLSASDPILKSYAKAIKAMKALPTNNPLSWAYQAAIHGTTVSVSPPPTAWNTCEHGTLYFWSWHRMYLYWFEKIIRKMSGDYGFALPYWNWTSPSERKLPAPFRDTSSELYTSHRNTAINDGTGSLPATDVSYSAAFAFTSFANANGTIQGTPHGDVHVDIGGWMGSVPTAGQDPIFYLHHCNIDRLWNLWLAQGGGRTDPLGDSAWKNTNYTFFNENGTQVKMTACDVLRCALQLKYTYEGEPAEVNEYCLKLIWPVLQREILIRLPIQRIVLESERVSFPLDIRQARQRIATIAESRTQKLFLELDVEAERQPGVVWEVYVGLPPNTEPDPEGPYYVGNVSLFGAGIRSEATHAGFKPAHFSFLANRALMTALRKKDDNLQVTIVPHGVLINGKPTRPKVESPASISQVSLTTETEKRQ